ncbi:MAG: DUF4363 family protein [Clostridiales bacterium]|nr:DUF4363 family protein [Clostridiales bacterium]
MKKLIVISCVFALLLGLSVTEMILTDNLYRSMSDKLAALDAQFVLLPEETDSEKNLASYREIEELWLKNRPFTLSMSNHALARTVDERLVTLRVWMEQNNAEESRVAANTARRLVDDLRDETFPAAVNIF